MSFGTAFDALKGVTGGAPTGNAAGGSQEVNRAGAPVDVAGDGGDIFGGTANFGPVTFASRDTENTGGSTMMPLYIMGGALIVGAALLFSLRKR